MKHLLLRLAARVLMLLIASGLLSGALAASEDAGAGAGVGRAGAGDALGGRRRRSRSRRRPTRTTACTCCRRAATRRPRAELRLGDEVVAQGEGTMRVIRCRLNAGATYTLALTGTGSGRLEVARETLSRCWSMPIELTDGGSYAKLIARAGDVHWYAVDAVRDGAAIFSATPESDCPLRLWLFDERGTLLAESESLPSGAAALSAALESGSRYLVRVAADGGGTGQVCAQLHAQRRDHNAGIGAAGRGVHRHRGQVQRTAAPGNAAGGRVPAGAARQLRPDGRHRTARRHGRGPPTRHGDGHRLCLRRLRRRPAP